MNKCFLGFLLLLWAVGMSAQSGGGKAFTALSARVLAIDHNLANETLSGESQTYALELGVRRQLTKHLAIAVPLKIGLIDVGELNNITITGLEVLGQLYPLGNEGKLSPYLHAGYGSVIERFEDANHQIPLGLGFNVKLDGNSWFSVQGEYRLSDQAVRDNVMAGLGYVYRLSRIDSDGDGIMNRDDECPDAPGPLATNGCPDTDMDGLTDAEDKCPTLAGNANLQGCPDSDRDGVIDPDDKCPEVAGQAKTDGCPDTDMDGIVDDEDDCPDLAGTAAYNGCPDTDGDGVPDSKDICPKQAGPAELMGCPDRDEDGIPDVDDKCPDLAGGAPMGCPDSDGDGLEDAEDSCPNTPGTINGCPDTDRDGVADDVDRCPSQAGPPDNAGCPIIEKEIQEQLEFAARAVQFETGSAKLKESSYIILSEIAGIMRQYRDYNLRITGHTDNVGADVTNLSLSERRAAACRDFIVATGIADRRISSAGFGETRPVADNSSAEGRRQNRRVEFLLTPGRRR